MNRLLLMLFVSWLPVAASAGVTALTGGRIHTMGPAGSLARGTVVIADGRIVDVGPDVVVPAGATVVDLSGKIVTPGLFSPYGQLGLTEVRSVKPTIDFIRKGGQFAAGFEVAHAFNPRSALIPVNRVEGITQAVIAPRASGDGSDDRSSSVFGGLAAVVDLSGADDSVVQSRAMVVASLGDGGGARAGGSRAMAYMKLRAALADAIDYAEHRRDVLRGRHNVTYSLSHYDLEALQPVLAGDVPLLVHADRASDLLEAVKLSREFGFRMVIAGGAESWLVASKLAAAGVTVILNATGNLPTSFDKLNGRLDTAARLQAAGVRFTFGGSSTRQTYNARNLTQAAGIAAANGLDRDAALRAITLVPAEMAGVADRYGSLETGKVANLVVWNDDPLELRSYPETVFIRGAAIAMESRQTLLRDRYHPARSGDRPAYRH